MHLCMIDFAALTTVNELVNMVPFEPELQLLLHSIRWQVEKPEISYSLGTFDEELALKLCVGHKLTPWLWLYVRKFSIGSDRFRNNIASELRKEEVKNKLQTRELSRVSTLFAEHEIVHVAFKGFSVEALFYKDFVECRYSDDIDFLIDSDDLELAHRVLMSSEYGLREDLNIKRISRFIQKHERWYRWRDVGYQKLGKGREKIDLHWRIADDFTFPAETKTLLAMCEPLELGTQNIPCLPFAMLFVYVCVHGYSDYFFRLRYMVDVYTAMQQAEFDLVEITELAESLGVNEKVQSSIATVNRFFLTEEGNDKFTETVVKRYIDASGLPARSHPNNAEWTAKDRWQHLRNQTRFRSKHSSWFAPLLARCKYNTKMVSQWPESVSPKLWYLVAITQRWLK